MKTLLTNNDKRKCFFEHKDSLRSTSDYFTLKKYSVVAVNKKSIPHSFVSLQKWEKILFEETSVLSKNKLPILLFFKRHTTAVNPKLISISIEIKWIRNDAGDPIYALTRLLMIKWHKPSPFTISFSPTYIFTTGPFADYFMFFAVIRFWKGQRGTERKVLKENRIEKWKEMGKDGWLL